MPLRLTCSCDILEDYSGNEEFGHKGHLLVAVTLVGLSWDDPLPDPPFDWKGGGEQWKLLQPWYWFARARDPDKFPFTIWKRKNGTESSVPMEAIWLKPQDCFPAKDIHGDAGIASLKDTFDRRVRNATLENVKDKPKWRDGALSDIINRDEGAVKSVCRMSAAIADCAMSMPPYNHLLGLSWIIRFQQEHGLSAIGCLPNLDNVAPYEGSPVWNANNGAFRSDMLGGMNRDGEYVSQTFSAEGEDNARIPGLVVVSNSVQVPPIVAGSVRGGVTQVAFRRDSGAPELPAEDWLAELPLRVVPLCDLTARFIDFGRWALLENKSIQNGNLRNFLSGLSAAIVATSRDLADFGARPGLNNWSLLEHLKKCLGKPHLEMPHAQLGDWLTFLCRPNLPRRIREAGDAYNRRWAEVKGILDKADQNVPKRELLETWLGAASYLVAALRDTQILREVVWAQWKVGLTETDKQKFDAAWESFPRPVAQFASGLLALQVDNRSLWQLAFETAESGEGEDYTERLFEALLRRILEYPVDGFQSYLSLRLGNGFSPRLEEEAFSAFSEEWPDFLKSVTDTYRPLLFPNRMKTSPEPHPVAIQVVDTLSQEGLDGHLGDIAGVLVFLKRKKEGSTWRCLNRVLPHVNGVDLAPILKPSALAEVNGIPACIITYNNRPIVAEPPGSRHKVIGGANGGGSDVLFLWPVAEKLPALVYGADYEYAHVAVRNSGALPPTLTAEIDWDDRSKGKHPFLPTVEGSWQIKNYAKFSYFRRVPLGTPLVKVQTDTKAPLVPDGVYPLAKELPEWPKGPGVETAEKSGEQSNETEKIAMLVGKIDPVLAVLFPKDQGFYPEARSSVTFNIEPPQTGFENWMRWVAGGEENAIKQEAGKYQTWLRKAKDKGDTYSLADPAFDPNKVAVRVRCLFGGETSETWEQNSIRGIEVKIANDTFAVASVDGDSKLSVTVKPGQVIQICVFPVLAEGAEGKLADVIRNGQVSEHAGTKLGPPWVGIVEVGKSLSEVAPDALYQAWELVPSGNAMEGHLKRNEGYAFASRATVEHQIWLWNGGLFEPPDKLEETDLKDWDGVAYHDRRNDECAQTEVRIAASKRADSKVRIFRDDRTNDPRALYYRVGLTLHSRYEAVMGRDAAGRSVTAMSNEFLGDPWKRAVLPVRLTKPLARPAVRFILPLTRRRGTTPSNGPAGPGLLVVLENRWFSEAGLVEKLDAEVQVVRLVQNGISYSRLNAGYDPILSSTPMGNVTADEAIKLEEAAIVGPLGHTFDLGAASPALLGSSFCVRLPACLGGQNVVTQDNFFARLRFRRSLRWGEEADHLASEWTAWEWVQFLPDAGRLDQSLVDTETGLPREVSAKDDAILIQGWTPPYPGGIHDSRQALYEYWLAVTDVVYNIHGLETERYRGTAIRDGNQFVFMDGAKIEPDGKIQIRLLELRKHPHASPDAVGVGKKHAGGSIWNRVFGDPNSRTGDVPPDAEMQLLAVSQPIHVVELRNSQ